MSVAQAADVTAASKIDAVTVFPAGAEITRIAKTRLPAGEHTIIFKDLPAAAIQSSIRVEGKATGALQIGSVDSRRLFVPRADLEVGAAERKQIEAEIEKLNDDKALLQAAILAAEAQKKLIENLADLPGKTFTQGTSPPAQPDWAALAQLIGERTAAAQKLILDTQIKIRDADKKITDLQKKLAPIAPAQEEQTEIKVFVTAGAPLEADLTVRYQIASAAWTPFYDARLTTGTKAVAPKLQLVRRASIQQRTGEVWDNVALTLSTTRPAAGSQAPDLRPMLVDLFDPSTSRPVAASAPPPPPAPMARSAAMADANKFQGAAKVMQERTEATQVNATIDGNAFQALYGIQGRVTVQQTGEAKRVQIDQSDIEPTLTARTVPKRDAKAFLYAKTIMPKTTAILPGQVSLFRDSTFVGTGRFPQLAPGEEHELGFGQDDNIRVRYAVAEEKRSESGIISTSKTDAKNFRITVKSLHERPVAMSVIDQQPVSLNQEVKIEFISKLAPSRKDMEDKRGLVAWDFNLNPDEERVIEFGHRITWPAAKQLQIN
jgi:uncharacterized protein (TIGR02231 family)